MLVTSYGVVTLPSLEPVPVDSPDLPPQVAAVATAMIAASSVVQAEAAKEWENEMAVSKCARGRL